MRLFDSTLEGNVACRSHRLTSIRTTTTHLTITIFPPTPTPLQRRCVATESGFGFCLRSVARQRGWGHAVTTDIIAHTDTDTDTDTGTHTHTHLVAGE